MNKLKNYFNKLKTTKTPEGLFNPFNEICDIHDKPNGHEIRLRNIEVLLNKHLQLGTKTIWLFEAPSYLGARRSGAPFVNEGMFEEIGTLLGTEEQFQKATETTSKTAMTSKMAWKVAKEFNLKPLIWESLMFHPHKPENPMTNRRPTKKELLQYSDILKDLIDLIRPERIIAVGRVAEHSAELMGIEVDYVRHPAQGGLREFREQMTKLYI